MESTYNDESPPVATVSNQRKSMSVRQVQKPSSQWFSGLRSSNEYSSDLDEADNEEVASEFITDYSDNQLTSSSVEEEVYNEITPYSDCQLSSGSFEEYCSIEEHLTPQQRQDSQEQPENMIAREDSDYAENEDESVLVGCRQESTLCKSRSARGSRPTVSTLVSRFQESFDLQPQSGVVDKRRLHGSNPRKNDNELGNASSNKIAYKAIYPGNSEEMNTVPTEYHTTMTSPHSVDRITNVRSAECKTRHQYCSQPNVNSPRSPVSFYGHASHYSGRNVQTLNKPVNRYSNFIQTRTNDAPHVNRTPAPRGLQRSMTMRETSRSKVDRSTSRMSRVSGISNSPTYNSKPLVNNMFSNYVEKTTNSFCLYSDSQVSSGRPPVLDFNASPQQRGPSLKAMMQVPRDSVGVWKFGEDNFFTTVPKVWTVSDCIAHVRNKIGRFGNGDLDLLIKNRCIMLDKGKSLSDYPGLKSLYVIRRPSSRDPHPSHQTSRPDDTEPFSDDTCVAMSCGHAVSPENLYLYAWKKIQNGGIEVTCPAIPDINKPGEQCSKTWEFQSISKLACLSNDENNLFCSKLFSNVLEKEANIYLCPVCNEAIFSSCKTAFKCFNCEKSGASFSFCVRCNRTTIGDICYSSECQESLPKIRALLRNCGTRTLVDVPNCPSVRACPVCHCVIEYDEGESCKHMTCPRNSCQTKFCFICLKVKTDKYYWPCGGAFEPCSPSPTQNI